MSIIRTASRSTNFKTAGYQLRKSGFLQSVPNAPSFIAVGSQASGVSSASVSWPTRHQVNDLGILVIESTGEAATITPAGWTHVNGSPITDIADSTGSKLMVLWRFAGSDNESQVSLTSVTDHVIAAIHVFRGVRTDTTPGNAYAVNTKTTASISVTWPSIITTCPNSMVICVASRPDDNMSRTVFSGFANANLINLSEANEGGNTTGNGGGFVVNYGIMTSIGSTGQSSGTMNVSTTNALLTFALEPGQPLLP